MMESMARAGQLTAAADKSVKFVKSPSGYNVAVGSGGQFQFEPGAAAEADLLTTKPKEDDIPDGFTAVQAGKGWKVIQDPSQWRTIVTTDNSDPMNPKAIHTQEFIGKGAGKGAPAPAAAPGAAMTMTNPQGQRVQVPADKVDQARKLGYQ